ncbi:hypothetical protein KIN20_009458 [Parelaphostrongylus tenuis]|uniref:Uncharacterized protein n=1 Tax=Parelaphostrongylus tenuis TaxID=148309 RepID=A0AAD5QKP1_PARTN|nr:hypothetical protein KIN20_009458 [Parelaphostrongylus tenuis]
MITDVTVGQLWVTLKVPYRCHQLKKIDCQKKTHPNSITIDVKQFARSTTSTEIHNKAK